MKTLLVGATGLLGPDICQRLVDGGTSRASPDSSDRGCGQARGAGRLGVELVEGDLKDAASLARACAGVQAVISTASSTLSRQAGDSIESVDQQGQLALVEAARKQASIASFRLVSRKPTHPVSVDGRQTRRRAGAEVIRHGVHDPPGVLLHGSVAHTGAGVRCRQRQGAGCTAMAAARSAGSPPGRGSSGGLPP